MMDNDDSSSDEYTLCQEAWPELGSAVATGENVPLACSLAQTEYRGATSEKMKAPDMLRQQGQDAVAEPGETEPVLLTLMSADGAQHPVPRSAAFQHSKLMSEMAEDTEDGATARDLEIPLPELSAGAVEAFVAFARQLGGDPRGVLGVGSAAFAEAWEAADRLIAGEWQHALAAAWSEELRAQARVGGGGEFEAFRTAAAELEAVLDPAVSPLLSMLDVGAVALLCRHDGEAASWAKEELAKRVTITATSAGFEVHRRSATLYRAYFTKDAVEQPSKGMRVLSGAQAGTNGRGMNVMLFHPSSGEVLSAGYYDFYGSMSREGPPGAKDSLAAALASLDEGTIVALAAKDDASGLPPHLVAAIQSCGGSGQQVGMRASFAMVGVKGATPGSAIEKYDPSGNPVTAKAAAPWREF